ncbi:MAG: hypothetical protein SGI88_07280 [Candidatus Hydrogenedentes bacterium]|nr:hypothetical protein [Candidatus Hydrogenedentota bacterium]
MKILASLVCCALWIPAYAQQSNTFPQKADPLHVRVQMFDRLMRDNHWNEGIFMQQVIFPPAGTEKPLVGSHEDGCGITAEYLAGYSHMYHATKDPKARERANKVFEGIEQLERHRCSRCSCTEFQQNRQTALARAGVLFLHRMALVQVHARLPVAGGP